MGFMITIQADNREDMIISSGYGDFSVGPFDKLARKYRHTGTYDEDSFKVGVDNVDDLADALAETQQDAENDDIQVIMSGWEDDVYFAELFAEETVESLFREIPWSYFVIMDKR